MPQGSRGHSPLSSAPPGWTTCTAVNWRRFYLQREASLPLGYHLSRDLSLIGGIALNTAFDFDDEGTVTSEVRGKVYRDGEMTLRYGPGVFAGAAWTLGR